MYSFEKLIVWQKAMDFCELIYRESRKFPKEEMFGLTSQLRRASTSISLNIAEGSASDSKREFKRFLKIALGSQYEVVTIIRLCYKFNFLVDENYKKINSDLEEIGRLLHGLINSLSKN
ncbi:MAG: four helix bundle protein [bacterium]